MSSEKHAEAYKKKGVIYNGISIGAATLGSALFIAGLTLTLTGVGGTIGIPLMVAGVILAAASYFPAKLGRFYHGLGKEINESTIEDNKLSSSTSSVINNVNQQQPENTTVTKQSVASVSKAPSSVAPHSNGIRNFIRSLFFGERSHLKNENRKEVSDRSESNTPFRR